MHNFCACAALYGRRYAHMCVLGMCLLDLNGICVRLRLAPAAYVFACVFVYAQALIQIFKGWPRSVDQMVRFTPSDAVIENGVYIRR